MGISTVSQMEIVEIKKKPGSCKKPGFHSVSADAAI